MTIFFVVLTIIFFASSVFLFLCLSSTFDELNKKKKLLIKAEDRIRQEYDANFRMKLKALYENVSPERLERFNSKSNKGSYKAMMKSIREYFQKKGNIISQEIMGEIIDESERFVMDRYIAINDNIWRSFQQYKRHVETEPFIMPKGTRLAYTQGNKTVIMVEQEPMVRSTLFTEKSAYGKRHGNSKKEKGVFLYEDTYLFRLAYPYLYYIFQIIETKGEEDSDKKSTTARVSIYMSKKAISGPSDILYKLPLPNVMQGREDVNDIYSYMCLNMDVKDESSKLTDLQSQIDNLIEQFWNRPFNTDGTGHRYRLLGDPRLDTLDRWEEASQDDPLFVCNVNWENGFQLKGLLEYILPGNNTTNNELDGASFEIKRLLNNSSDELGRSIAKKSEKCMKRLSNLSFDDDIEKLIKKELFTHNKTVLDRCIEE